jgi:hypothetical protein
MANLIIQENGEVRTRPAVNGEELTIRTPCDCSSVTGVQINNVTFPFCDTCGNSLQDIHGKFAEGSLIRVMIDTVNVRAYILNSARVTPKAHTHVADEITSGTFAGKVVANSNSQTYSEYLIRNQKLKKYVDNSSIETPSVNGEICWMYE